MPEAPLEPVRRGYDPTGLLAHYRRECHRFLRLWRQTLSPPVLTTTLYILVFGKSLGTQIREVDGFPYIQYIFPGLLIMGVINNAYANVATSLYVARTELFIQDLLTSPLSYFEMVLAYVGGAVTRGLFVGLLTLLVGILLTGARPVHPLLFLVTLFCVSMLFASLGTVAALWATSWDNVNMFVSFIITPLTFLGGVFYSIEMLPEPFRTASKFNPIFYVINAIRYSILGTSDVSYPLAIAFLAPLALVGFALCVHLFRIGYRIQS